MSHCKRVPSKSLVENGQRLNFFRALVCLPSLLIVLRLIRNTSALTIICSRVIEWYAGFLLMLISPGLPPNKSTGSNPGQGVDRLKVCSQACVACLLSMAGFRSAPLMFSGVAIPRNSRQAAEPPIGGFVVSGIRNNQKPIMFAFVTIQG